MSPRLPRLTAREVQQVLEQRGFVVVRQRGSHRILRDDLGRRVTLPCHSGVVIHPKVLTSIMSDAGLAEDDFA
jgi:predicted RNA binding protein YcfA (HicA-like mRNA interferase family)